MVRVRVGWAVKGDPSAWAYFVRQGFDEICISTFLFALNIDICTNGYYGMIVPGNVFSSSSHDPLRNG